MKMKKSDHNADRMQDSGQCSLESCTVDDSHQKWKGNSQQLQDETIRILLHFTIGMRDNIELRQKRVGIPTKIPLAWKVASINYVCSTGKNLSSSAASIRNLATLHVPEHNLQDIGLEMGIGHACESLPEGAIEIGIDSGVVEQIKDIILYAGECAESAYELDDDNQITAPRASKK